MAAAVALAVLARVVVGGHGEPASRLPGPAGTPREQRPPAATEAPTVRPDASRPRDAASAAAPPPARAASDARRVVQQALADKLERELTPDDYDRLAAAVLQFRTALATLRRDPGDSAAAADLRAALAAMQATSGLPPSEIGRIFPPDETPPDETLPDETAGDSAE